jgi:hypothetical protein
MFKECFNNVFVMNVNEMCPNKCSGNGDCKDIIGCACKPGYITHDCSMTIRCRDECNKHGTCLNTAKCSCFNGWSGETCADVIPCPGNCTSIENGLCQADKTCKCNEGYSGADCSVDNEGDAEDPFNALLNLQALEISEEQAELLKEEYHCLDGCSDNGLCDQVNKKCVCFVYYI